MPRWSGLANEVIGRRYLECFLFGGQFTSPLSARILHFLRERDDGEATRTDLYQFFRCNIDSDRIRAALTELEKHEFIEIHAFETSGRAKEVIRLRTRKSRKRHDV
jgi:hypothetical protein